MQTCSECGAEKKRQGILFPTRRLCACETRSCYSCGEPATVVEFQKPVKDKEPALPKKSNDVALFACDEHAPEGAPSAAPLKPRKKSARLFNIDPAWHHDKPPAGAVSMAEVECWACKDIHKMKDRRMHNGTKSQCPKCGDGMYTHAYQEEAR